MALADTEGVTSQGSVLVTRREVDGIAEPVEDKADVAAGLMAHLQQVPGNARYYDVALDPVTGPSPEDVGRAAQKAVMIRVRLVNEPPSKHRTQIKETES